MPAKVRVSVETSPKKTFASALDWPGWSRAGKDEGLALEVLATYVARYRAVADEVREPFDDTPAFDVVETVTGGGGTAFGVPSVITELDRRRVTKADAERLASLVEAAWVVFDRVAARSPAELRKGPRGGGRDRDKMIGHVIEADHAYAREIGVRLPTPSLEDRAAVDAERAAMLGVLRQPSDGSPLTGRTWTTRYAARRIAWHALDHAWEMEDRTERGD
jgi:hypothetical protein